MDKKRNILICLEKLDIGGVETFVYNQTKTFKKRGYGVIILSKEGIFSKELEKYGIKCIDFDFEEKIYYDYTKILQILEIFKKYNINEVYINQFKAINTIMPACLIANIPYIVYIHISSKLIDNPKTNPFDYFEKQIYTFKDNFQLLFECAYKIIFITPKIKEYTINRYNIENKEKCIVIPNSINFAEYTNQNRTKELNNFLIISRCSEEKVTSILNGIDLYKTIKDNNTRAKLIIAGDGKEINKIKEYVSNKKIQDVKFAGAILDVKKVIEENDVVIGIGRCLIEGVAMHRISIISGYDGIKGVLDKHNIYNQIDENFCGKSLKNKGNKEVCNKILNLTEREIEEITSTNYNVIKEKLDINKNIYLFDLQNFKYNISNSKLMNIMARINYTIGIKEELCRDKIEKNWQEHIEYKNWMEEKENRIIEHCKQLEKENILFKNEGKNNGKQ